MTGVLLGHRHEENTEIRPCEDSGKWSYAGISHKEHLESSEVKRGNKDSPSKVFGKGVTPMTLRV